MSNTNLERFRKAQEESYDAAFQEIQNGKKMGHWMWYIFPQLRGLGRSEMAKYYGISDIEEAREYLEDDFLGGNLMEISSLVLGLDADLKQVFGATDYKKLRSCMTLFAEADPDCEVFFRVIDKFYDGEPCEKTLEMLEGADN